MRIRQIERRRCVIVPATIWHDTGVREETMRAGKGLMRSLGWVVLDLNQ